MKRERLRRYRFLALFLGLVLATWWGLGWAQGQKQWGPFRGQFVDEETGQPIAGAAILVVWLMDIPMLVQDVQVFDDAREAVTDAEGRFEIPQRLPALFWLFIRKPEVILFAPGYGHYEEVVTPPDGRPFVDPTIVQMSQLKTHDQWCDYVWRLPPGGVPEQKMSQLVEAINKERSSRAPCRYPRGN